MDLYALMPPLMFLALILFLFSGYPVAFSLGAVGMIFGFLGIALDLFPASLLGAMPDRIFGIMSNQLLLAIPFFTFMGIILEKSGLAEDLLDTMGKLFGPLRGGLALSVVFVGAILAATTGVVAASVMAMGLISLPVMLKYGYNPRFASGVILGSATLAQIIPPSTVLIVLADQLGVSVGDMYKAALIPAGLTVGFYFLYVIYVALFRPAWAPALPPEGRPDAGKEVQAAFALLSYLLVGVGAYGVGRFLPTWAEWLEILLALSLWTLVLLPWIRKNPLLKKALLSMVPPLGPHLPGAGHGADRPCHPHGGWGHGGGGGPGPGRPEPPPQLPRPLRGHGGHGQAHRLRHLHPHRLHPLQPGLPGRGRGPLGGGLPHGASRRGGGLHPLRDGFGLPPGLLHRLL